MLVDGALVKGSMRQSMVCAMMMKKDDAMEKLILPALTKSSRCLAL